VDTFGEICLLSSTNAAPHTQVSRFAALNPSAKTTRYSMRSPLIVNGRSAARPSFGKAQ